MAAWVSYGMSSERLGGLYRSRSARRDNLGRFVSDEWRCCGLDDFEVRMMWDFWIVW